MIESPFGRNDMTDDNLDILQNLEFSVVEIWRGHPEMSDYAALRAYEAAFQIYRAELRGHAPKPPGLTGLDAEAFEAVKAMCEFRLGTQTLFGSRPRRHASRFAASAGGLFAGTRQDLSNATPERTGGRGI